MARKKHLINVHTSTGTTAPTGASLYLGEIAVQHTPNDPALWIKVGSAETSTEYEKFIGLTEITNIFNMSQILGSGYTYSGIPYVNSATTIADAYSALTKELIDDELVTAAALNDLNDRIPEPVDLEPLSASVVTNVQNINILSAVVEENELVTAAALNDLNDKINMISANTSGDYITREEFEDHEEVAAAAFNDLNSRLIDLADNTDAEIEDINSQFTVLSGMVRELSGNSGAGAITSVTIDGSGNVVTNATYVNSALTITKGIVEAGILGSGYTYSGLPYVNSATSIADAYSAITKELIDDEKVTAAALNDLNNRIANVPSSADVESLSAVVFTLSATLEDDELVIAAALNDLNDKVNTISASTSGDYMTVEEFEESEEIIAAALNDLNARIIDLSGDTSDISDSVSNHDQQIQVLSGLVADISGNTGGGGGTDTACTETGHYSPATTASTLGTTAATTSFIKGINIDSKKHAISVATGTVVTAQTQLSTATTGTGNVMTNITVSNHQITKNFGMTIPSWATASTKPSYTATEVGVPAWATASTKPSYTASEVGALPTGTTLDNVADGTTRKLSNYASSGNVTNLSAATTAMSANVAKIAVTGVTVTGTGNAITNASYANSALTLTKGNVLTTETLTGVSAGGTNLTVTNKIAAIPSASSNTFGVVKTGNFITNTNGSIAVSTGTTNTTVARGDQFLAVSAATTGNTSNLNTLSGAAHTKITNLSAATMAHTATTIANGTSSQMHLPTVSASDNGKILLVKNGAWSLETPVTVYTGSGTPSQSLGGNGDIYLQTS